ncbi:MAG: hypothetical protein ACLUVA_09120 [Faecalibacterium sp.]
MACGLPGAKALAYAAQMVEGTRQADAGEAACTPASSRTGSASRRHAPSRASVFWRSSGLRAAAMDAVIAAL